MAETSNGLVWTRWWNLGFHETRKLSQYQFLRSILVVLLVRAQILLWGLKMTLVKFSHRLTVTLWNNRLRKLLIDFSVRHALTVTFNHTTLSPLTCRIWCAPNNTIRWQMGFNSVFEELNAKLNPICHLVTLGAHHTVRVSSVRVNLQYPVTAVPTSPPSLKTQQTVPQQLVSLYRPSVRRISP